MDFSRRERKNQHQRHRRQMLKRKRSPPRLPTDTDAVDIVNTFRREVTSQSLQSCQSCDIMHASNDLTVVSLEHPCIRTFDWSIQPLFGNNPTFHPVIGNDGFPLLLHKNRENHGGRDGTVRLCKRCFQAAKASKREKMSLMALVNGCWTGNKVFDLTFLEEMLITINHVKGVVLQICASGVHQTRGNFVILPNDSGITSTTLPVSWNTLPKVLRVVLSSGWKKQSLVQHLTVRRRR